MNYQNRLTLDMFENKKKALIFNFVYFSDIKSKGWDQKLIQAYRGSSPSLQISHVKKVNSSKDYKEFESSSVVGY